MPDSNTPETQALLPVRPELLPCPFCGSVPTMMPDDSYGHCGIGCHCEAEPFVQARKDEPEKAIAAWNHRISHSLPRDVGMQEAWQDLRVAATAALTSLEISVQSFPFVERKLREALAALTPSALSGDAGEGERDRLVALWHDTDVGNVITLPALLGMTDEQYSAWVRDPSNAALTTPPTPDRIGKDAVREALLDLPFANTAPIEWDHFEWISAARALSATPAQEGEGDA